MKNELRVVLDKIKNDPELYYGYQANIAMAFKDEFWRTCKTREYLDLMDHELLHEIANQAAKNFLDLWVSTTKNEDSPNEK